MQAPSRPHVRVSVDKSRGDRFARGINDRGRTSIQCAGFADSLDSIVLDQDISLFDDLIPLHGDDACIFE